MAISQSLITNLSLSSFGLATIGGIIYGSYELLKDVNKPISELLDIKKRKLLSFATQANEDDAHWKINWAQYIEDNTHDPVPPRPESTQATTVSAPTELKRDIWELNDWEGNKNNKETVPASFKQKCQEKSNKEYAGIWKQEFKEILKYCTKEILDED